MDIYSKVGTKVIFAYPDSGYPHHQKTAAEHLELGRVYTVERIDVGGFHTDVFLAEVPGVAFNSVLFEHSVQTIHRHKE